VRGIAVLCPDVPSAELLRILLPSPGPRQTGIQAADRWERATRNPVEALAAYVRQEWAREEKALMAAERRAEGLAEIPASRQGYKLRGRPVWPTPDWPIWYAQALA